MTAILTRLRDIWTDWSGRCQHASDADIYAYAWFGEDPRCGQPIGRLRYVLLGACKQCRDGA